MARRTSTLLLAPYDSVSDPLALGQRPAPSCLLCARPESRNMYTAVLLIRVWPQEARLTASCYEAGRITGGIIGYERARTVRPLTVTGLLREVISSCVELTVRAGRADGGPAWYCLTCIMVVFLALCTVVHVIQ